MVVIDSGTVVGLLVKAVACGSGRADESVASSGVQSSKAILATQASTSLSLIPTATHSYIQQPTIPLVRPHTTLPLDCLCPRALRRARIANSPRHTVLEVFKLVSLMKDSALKSGKSAILTNLDFWADRNGLCPKQLSSLMDHETTSRGIQMK